MFCSCDAVVYMEDSEVLEMIRETYEEANATTSLNNTCLYHIRPHLTHVLIAALMNL